MKRAFLGVLMGALSLYSSTGLAFIWPNVPQEIAQGLQSEDEGERRAAAERLHELPQSIAVSHVLTALDDSDAEVRLAASRVAVEMRVQGSGERVIDWLGERDVRLRLMACEVLRVSPSSRALAALSRVLGDSNAEVRVAAALTLGTIGDREAVAALLGHLDDASVEVRTAMIEALGRIGDHRAVVPLLGKVQDNAVEVRRMTVRVLGDLGDQRASSALIVALRDKANEVRREAIESLGRLRANDAVSALAPLIQERGSLMLRETAIEALGRIGGDVAIEALLKALEQDEPTSEESVVRRALGRGGPSMIPRLVSTMQQSSHPNVVSGCALVLGELGSEEQIPLIVGEMQRGKVSERVGLAALAKMRSVKALPFVLEMLDGATPDTRRAAMLVAEQLLNPSDRDGRFVDPLLSRLMDSKLDLRERELLIRLLGKTGSPRAVTALSEFAVSTQPRLKRAAIDALGEIGPAGQDAELLTALDDTEPSIRFAAAYALSRVSAPATAGVLYRRLMHASEQDRLALGIALSGAMQRATDDRLVTEVVEGLDRVRPPLRDVLVEGLGRMRTRSAGEALMGLARSPWVDDRRKVAEALGGHAERVDVVRQLLSDADPSVQANAAWSLGKIGAREDAARLQALVTHRDAAVASNAVGALGLFWGRGLVRSSEPFCAALGDSRAYVRVNALAALRLANARCGDGSVERQILNSDASVMVRIAAARLLSAVPSTIPEADERGLRRCLLDDRSGQVAHVCHRAGIERRGDTTDEIIVYVVPDGRQEPMGRASYALVFETGSMRLGLADRRGAVYESMAPRGKVELAVPAIRLR
ncbi:MAG TPA: HEAT repeat domain-containing protein [Polyangiaceae bacterium]|nr:HEAT repeat domain-containing protein [Polyangiaceae bacterium]HNZ20930.1 HEAT repeat domain-containing protein [Polyangiaceae bacterium]HOD25638.1 HEAT repeat domain-containing protein [Polyangiaceae bacterium]HOE47611.1 HEAT repeat domain-containing protein [Polyangiaceae bacterium]HOG98800.1 HEAT repeat domain-containing protein [Polyangiaceae bacterium]